MTPRPATSRNPWLWIPSLYFAQGIPSVVAMSVSVLMYKRLGVSNADIALYTSWLYLPWVIKPLWSPFVDMFRTKRFWIVSLQLLMGASLACVALALPGPRFLQYTLAIFWLMAFSSATHDIAADGFYMLGLDPHEQAAFVGIRSTFFRVAMITGQGALVGLAGALEKHTPGRVANAWAITFSIMAAVFTLTGIYHLFMLPRPATDHATRRTDSTHVMADFLRVFVEFFRKPGILVILGFMLFYRFNEAQLVKLIQPFLLDPRSKGGLELTTSQVGFAYGTIGVIGLMLGGILGGVLISRGGLRAWIWPMVLIIHVPDLVYVFLSHLQPTRFPLICAVIGIEQFSYGFGFTAYMLFMIMVAQGEHKTAHYALCTGFMALGMMIPGMFSGKIQEHLGYPHFFLWVMLSMIPSFLVVSLVKIDPAFGKKRSSPPGCCSRCGYSLEGNVSGTCPECGQPIGAAAAPSLLED